MTASERDEAIERIKKDRSIPLPFRAKQIGEILKQFGTQKESNCEIPQVLRCPGDDGEQWRPGQP